jgi:rhamnosyltransferase
MINGKKVSVMFMTYNAINHLDRCLPPVFESECVDEVLVVNSSGTDGTVERARAMGANVLVIPRNEFNHGATKEIARRSISGDIVVMMSPDAYGTPGFLEKLVSPIASEGVALTYSRQIPHEGADFFESFPRSFNYPDTSELRSLQTFIDMGPRAIFCSNTCAAYLVSALDEVGGFPTVLTAEDTIVAARLLKSGASMMYVADSVVFHSHACTLGSEFRRHFDAGYCRNVQFKEELLDYGGDNQRGMDFVKSFLLATWEHAPLSVGYAGCLLAAKLLGYKMGSLAERFPNSVSQKLSSQDFYWNSKYYNG